MQLLGIMSALMIEYYHRLARKLSPLSWVFWALLLVSAGGFAAAFAVNGNEQQEALTLASVCLALWSLGCLVLIRVFQTVPPAGQSPEGLVARLREAIARTLRWVMALVVTALLIAVVAVSMRAVSILT